VSICGLGALLAMAGVTKTVWEIEELVKLIDRGAVKFPPVKIPVSHIVGWTFLIVFVGCALLWARHLFLVGDNQSAEIIATAV
jgi:hypothetical protein